MVRDITIHPVLNGFVCTVGCQQVVFRSTDAMVAEIKNYYDDPKTTENRFLKEKVNDTLCVYPETANLIAPTPAAAPPPPVNECGEEHRRYQGAPPSTPTAAGVR